MKKLIIGCAVAGLIALSPKSEAHFSGSLSMPRLSVVPTKDHETGFASWYGEELQGNMTASGEVYDLNGLTAAHHTLPFGTTIRVTNLRNHRSILLRVNDRGPRLGKRLLDVSWSPPSTWDLSTPERRGSEWKSSPAHPSFPPSDKTQGSGFKKPSAIFRTRSATP